MKLTGGQARGRSLRGRLPDGVRPTSARVREAVFSMLGQDLDGLAFLDAFGGSGLMGLEAWSRGAQVVVYERQRATARWIQRQGEALGAQWTVQRAASDTHMLAHAVSVASRDGAFAMRMLCARVRSVSCLS